MLLQRMKGLFSVPTDGKTILAIHQQLWLATELHQPQQDWSVIRILLPVEDTPPFLFLAQAQPE